VNKLTDRILSNQPLCTGFHIFIGASLPWIYHFTHWVLVLTPLLLFTSYELCQQYSRKKDNADEELREALVGFFPSLLVYVLTKLL